MHAAAKLPEYVPPWKGKAKVCKDMDTVKSTLETPLFPDGILFDGLALGYIPMIKFQDWDLMDSEKFQHLDTNQLMKQSKEGVVTVLQPWKWQCGLEDVGLLHYYGFCTFTRHQSQYSSSGNYFA